MVTSWRGHCVILYSIESFDRAQDSGNVSVSTAGTSWETRVQHLLHFIRPAVFEGFDCFLFSHCGSKTESQNKVYGRCSENNVLAFFSIYAEDDIQRELKQATKRTTPSVSSIVSSLLHCLCLLPNITYWTRGVGAFALIAFPYVIGLICIIFQGIYCRQQQTTKFLKKRICLPGLVWLVVIWL